MEIAPLSTWPHSIFYKTVLWEYILTISYKIQSVLLFDAFSHMSSLYQKFKALLIERGEWDWSESREGGEHEKRETGTSLTQQIWCSSVSCWKSPVGATEIHQCPQWLVTWALYSPPQWNISAAEANTALHRLQACKRPAAYMICHKGKRGKRCPSGYCQLAFTF